MSNPEAALRNAARLYSLDDFSQAITDLRHKRQTIFELPMVVITDDFQFARDNADHPSAHTNRFTRMRAADFFKALAEGDPSRIDSDVLAELHQALFDRCYSVRMSIAEALEKLARSESIPFLERLAVAEDEGQDIRDVATRAIERCKES